MMVTSGGETFKVMPASEQAARQRSFTIRRFFCLHRTWTRAAYAEYGTGKGPIVLEECDRCGLVREADDQ